MTKRVGLAISCIALFLVAWTYEDVQAADSYQLGNAQAQSITAHGSCARISNQSGSDIFVPTKTLAEWNSFKSNPPSGVSITLSCGCAASGACPSSSDGAVCTTYSSNSAVSPTTCSSIAVASTCSNGSWSTPPAGYGSCSQGYRSCAASGACPLTSDGGTCATYSSGTVYYPSSCPSPRTSTCNDGTWSSSPYSYGSCSVGYSYSWQYDGWDSCSASCGGGTQDRSVWCERSDGSSVSDSYCGGGKPSSSQSCNTQSCYSYSWEYGSWSSCGSECNGTQTRSVWCERSDGSSVSDSYCGGGKPSSSQSCNGSGTSCSSCSSAGCNYGSCGSSGTSCPAQAPAYCWSSPGSCSYGTTDAGGSCSASDPSYYGGACSLGTSAANACGQTQSCSGTYDCSKNCTGSCNPPANSCSFNWNPRSCGSQWITTGSCGTSGYPYYYPVTQYTKYYTFGCQRSTDNAWVSDSYCGGTPPSNQICSQACSVNPPSY